MHGSPCFHEPTQWETFQTKVCLVLPIRLALQWLWPAQGQVYGGFAIQSFSHSFTQCFFCIFGSGLRLSFAAFSAEHRWSFPIDFSRETSISCPKAEAYPNILVDFLQLCPTLTSTGFQSVILTQTEFNWGFFTSWAQLACGHSAIFVPLLQVCCHLYGAFGMWHGNIEKWLARPSPPGCDLAP